jgi:ankyrin repeat protein
MVAFTRNIEKMQALFEYAPDLDVNTPDHYGTTALDTAAVSDFVAGMELLFSKGAIVDLGPTNGSNYTPFIYAVDKGRYGAVECLLKHDANVNVAVRFESWGYDDPEDQYIPMGNTTPLHIAAWAGKMPMAKLLLDYHANPDARNDAGQTPRDVMESHPDVTAEQLQQYDQWVLQSKDD